jgi:predicted AAA+ superfamily ATPase
MDKEIAFVVKEEILRNVLKTHTIILLLGWRGTGKTVSSLRAMKGLWKPYYFNASGASSREELYQHNDNVIVVGQLNELPKTLSAETVLLIDDFDGAAEEVVTAVKKFISERSFPGKILITAQAQPKLDEVGPSVDAVVRMKEGTAQVLHTRLRDIS